MPDRGVNQIARAHRQVTTTGAAARDDDLVTFVTTGGVLTFTLVSAEQIPGQQITLKTDDSGSSGNVVTIAAQAGEDIDGDVTVSLTDDDQYVTLKSDGTNWRTISSPSATAIGSIEYLAGAYANGTTARELINLFENTETTSLNALQTGGWAPFVGIWRVISFEISHFTVDPGVTIFALWKLVEPYTSNVIEQASWTYSGPGTQGDVVTIDTVNDVPTAGVNPSYDFDNPCDLVAFSIDPTTSAGSCRWRLGFERTA